VIHAVAEATWFGLAAAFSSIAGVLLAWASHRTGKRAAEREAEAKAHEQLLAARREAEQLSEELHQLRMKKTEGRGNVPEDES
jgi:hypothetical protein